MTVGESQAISTLLSWIAGRRPFADGQPRPTEAQMRQAAEYLADRTLRATYAGWTGERLREAWPQPAAGEVRS